MRFVIGIMLVGVIFISTGTVPIAHSFTGNTLQKGQSVRNLRVGGLERTYLVFVPKDLDVTKPVPVILSFHGGSSSAEKMIKFTDLNAKAGPAGFIVVYPDGYKHSWNAGGGVWGPAYAEHVDDITFVKKILDDLGSLVNIDPRRIYATGMSNGSAMAYRVGCELSDRVAAVAGVVSFLTFPDCKPKRPVPVIHFWGTADPMPLEGAPGATSRREETEKTIARWVQIDGCSNDTEVTFKNGAAQCVVHPKCQGGAEVTLCTIVGMGHRWPGVMWPRWTNRIFGPGTDDIIATDVMLSFFKNHPMPANP
jgi:polyhydroxybutyrate depolymerase